MKYTKEELSVPFTEEFRAVLSRRKKSKGGTPRYYLYTQDSRQDLIIAAESYPTNKILFRISASGKEFEKDSKFYLGKIEHGEHNPEYDVYFCPQSGKKRLLNIRYFRTYERDTKERKFQITMLNDGQEELLEMEEFANFHQDFPKIETRESYQNFYFKYKGKLAFAIYQIEEDEFQIIADEPFNIFMAFAIACTTMVYVKSE